MSVVEFKKQLPAQFIEAAPCKKCGGTKFYARFGGCVECVRLANKKRLEKTPRKKLLTAQRKWREKNREYANKVRREWSVKNPERHILSAARKAARVAGVKFNLRIGDIIIPERCPVFNIPLKRGIGRRGWDSPSIDRIIPERGYTRGNIVIVSWRANFIKSDASLQELITLVKFYRKATKD